MPCVKQDVQRVAFSEGEVTATNGAISGHFECDQSLEMKSSNAPIDIHVNMRPSAKSEEPTTVSIESTGGFVAIVHYR